MVKPLFDTNILIDYLNAVPEARQELALYETWGVSIITWMEVMIGTDETTEAATRRFLANFDILPIDASVAELAVVLRKARRLKLPDAIIHATASVHSMLLVTRNQKDFPWDAPGIRMPYRLKP
ncbi:MAG: type II toxin-antitoxin system VapC family toxin [Mesorhizobium sp.]|nr:type II toxin-antitoxin system VapC family toxin [Mesorhizobium sp.]MCO5161647.1 type II toxin-antitoxin system VapC family toxin [Mesorhizobium sp.]